MGAQVGADPAAQPATPPQPAGPAPAPMTVKEVECMDDAKVRCHHDFRERCPAISRKKHCCRHWYNYLGFCYAWSLDWCMGPPKHPGVPCKEAPQAPAAAPKKAVEDTEDVEEAESEAAEAKTESEAGSEGGSEATAKPAAEEGF